MTEKVISLVRPFITLVAVFGLTLGFFTDRVTGEAYVPLMAMAITYWYTARENSKSGTPTVLPSAPTVASGQPQTTIIDKRA